MSELLQSTRSALRFERTHDSLRAAIRSTVEDAPCIGHKMVALRMAIADLMEEHPDDLAAEAPTILREVSPLTFRCAHLRKRS